MQIFEQKYTTKNDISLYSTKYNISKVAFLLAALTLEAAELLFRLKVRGERLKARSFYRFALNCFYVVARGRVVTTFTRHACQGYHRMRRLGELTPSTKPMEVWGG